MDEPRHGHPLAAPRSRRDAPGRPGSSRRPTARPLRRRLLQLLGDGPPIDPDAAADIIDRVAGSSAVEQAAAVAEAHARVAIAQLPALPAGPARDALAELARYVARRRT